MTRTIFLRWLGLLLLVLATSSCATVTRHGDTKLRDNKNVVFQTIDELVFPISSVGQAATYRYRVRDLPQVIYPLGFYLEVPAEEAFDSRHDQPWRTCLIRASLSKPDGVPFFVRTLDLSKDWNGHSAFWTSKQSALYFPFTGYFGGEQADLPEHLSYDLHIQVLRSSARATDTLRVHAITGLFDRQSTSHSQ